MLFEEGREYLLLERLGVEADPCLELFGQRELVDDAVIAEASSTMLRAMPCSDGAPSATTNGRPDNTERMRSTSPADPRTNTGMEGAVMPRG